MQSIFVPTLVFSVAVGVCGLLLLLPATRSHASQVRFSGGLLTGLSLVFLAGMYLASAATTQASGELAQRIGWLLLGAASIGCAARIVVSPKAAGAGRWFAALLVCDASLCLSIGATYLGTILLAAAGVTFQLLRARTSRTEGSETVPVASDAVMAVVGGGVLAVVLLGTTFLALSDEAPGRYADGRRPVRPDKRLVESAAQSASPRAAATRGIGGLGVHLFEDQAPAAIGAALLLLVAVTGSGLLGRPRDSSEHQVAGRTER
jgi:hypothetical protein